MMTKQKLTDSQIHASMINGYNFLILNETYSQAMQRNMTESVFYPFPIDEITIGDVKMLIEYFAEPRVEEYEKCRKLDDLIKNWNKVSV